MDKPTTAHLAAFAMALAVILGGSTVFYAAREKQYETYVTTQHRESLSQLLSSLDQLDTALQKASYLPEGAMRQTLAADIWKESQLASAALAALPLEEHPLEQVESYISKVGDYAYYLLRSSLYDRAVPEEWDTLCTLREQASGILNEVNVLKEQVDTGSAAFRALTASAASEDAVSTSLSAVNDEFPEYPSLIYDGPYSDHVSQRTPKALTDLSGISSEDALKAAAELLSTDISRLELLYQSVGQIPCYGIRCNDAVLTLTVQGGLSLSYTRQPADGEAAISVEQALSKAADFLEQMGYPNLQHSYYQLYENTLTINFHSLQQDVLCYPDLIKVGVSLADGSVVHMDASGYLMNHTARTLAESSFSETEAGTAVPDTLRLQQINRCLIPTTGYHETACWELVCETKAGTHVLLYLNDQTGQTENLLLLIESENGTLTR